LVAHFAREEIADAFMLRGTIGGWAMVCGYSFVLVAVVTGCASAIAYVLRKVRGSTPNS